MSSPVSLIERCTSAEQPGWLRLGQALWPDDSPEQHLAEMASFCANPERYVQFMAYSSSRDPLGFVEAALRTDYVNGTASSPVAFVEGIYARRRRRRTAFRHRSRSARAVGRGRRNHPGYAGRRR